MFYAILAVLLLGPQYGLQIRDEIKARAELVKAPNSGQIYQTIERLLKSNLIRQIRGSSHTRYELLEPGVSLAKKWLSGDLIDERETSLDEVVTHVLIARSLPQIDAETLINKYITKFSKSADASIVTARTDANSKMNTAICDWLIERKADGHKFQTTLEVRPATGRPPKFKLG